MTPPQYLPPETLALLSDDARAMEVGSVRWGPRNPAWRGDNITEDAGRNRAQRWYPVLGVCEECGVKPAVDRHHKDGHTRNNSPDNISRLCRRCHQTIDGRLELLQRVAYRNPPVPPRPCIECGRLEQVTRRRKCQACYRREMRREKKAAA